jgi:tetratricopeptide (TPR) repeat protein
MYYGGKAEIVTKWYATGQELLRQTREMLAAAGDRIDPDTREKIQAAADRLRAASDGDDAAQLKASLENLDQLASPFIARLNIKPAAINQPAQLPPPAIPYYRSSAQILERGIPIDRAFNEVNRGRDVKRGGNGADTPDVGLAPVYGYLGVSYMRLGLIDQADRTFRYMIHLEPTDPDSYLKMANLQIQRGRLDDAAATLVDVILLDNAGPSTPPAWQLLNQIFQQINTEPYPCILIQNGHAQLDTQRTVVRQAILQAYREFVRNFIQAHRIELAQQARNNAVNMYGFHAELFDELFDPDYMKQFPIPIPADPVFYKPPPVRFALMMPEVQKAFIDTTGISTFDTINEEIVAGRAVYYTDQPIDGKTYRIKISEEGNLISKEPLN